MTGMKRWVGLSLALICAACSKAPERAEKPQPAADEPMPYIAPDMPGAPADQLALVKAVAAGRNDPNFCATFQATKMFQDWSARITDFRTSTVNRSIDITFDAGDHVQLEQVVQTTDPLYSTIEALRMGETVRISGAFTHGNSECGYQLGVIGVKLSKISKTGR